MLQIRKVKIANLTVPLGGFLEKNSKIFEQLYRMWLAETYGSQIGISESIKVMRGSTPITSTVCVRLGQIRLQTKAQVLLSFGY